MDAGAPKLKLRGAAEPAGGAALLVLLGVAAGTPNERPADGMDDGVPNPEGAALVVEPKLKAAGLVSGWLPKVGPLD